MKPKKQLQVPGAVALVCLALARGNVCGQAPAGNKEAFDARIAAVFLAQTHVMKPDQPHFRLTGNRDALLKVHVVSASGGPAPDVVARASSGGETTTLKLRGPEHHEKRRSNHAPPRGHWGLYVAVGNHRVGLTTNRKTIT